MLISRRTIEESVGVEIWFPARDQLISFSILKQPTTNIKIKSIYCAYLQPIYLSSLAQLQSISININIMFSFGQGQSAPLDAFPAPAPAQPLSDEEQFHQKGTKLQNLVLDRTYDWLTKISTAEGEEVFDLIYWFTTKQGYEKNATGLFNTDHGHDEKFVNFLDCLPHGETTRLFHVYMRKFLEDRGMQYSQFQDHVKIANECAGQKHSKAYYFGFGKSTNISNKMQRAFVNLANESGES